MCVPGTAEIVRDRIREEGPPRLTRRRALLGAAGAAAAAAALPVPALARRGDPAGNRIADLSHVFSEDFPLYPGAAPTTREVLVTVPANGYYGQRWTLWEHAGTHMDAPAHFDADGRTTPQLRPDELVAPAVVVDIAARAARDPDTVVTPDDLRAFERRHGRIPAGAIVCMHSGWESRAGSTETYRNADAGGTMRFPGFGLEAAQWLLAERDARAIGVDTLSLDHGPSATFDVHYAWCGSDRYGLENLRGLKAIPPRGATLIVGVVPWRAGSGGPCRVLATW